MKDAPDWWQDVTSADMRWQVPERFNIAACCSDLQDPQAVGLVVDDETGVAEFTFGDLVRLSQALAGHFAAAGLSRGARVGVMVPQGMECLVGHLAAFRSGLVSVPLSVKFGPEAVAYRLGDSGAEALVIHRDCYDHVADGVASVASLRTVVMVGGEGLPDSPLSLVPAAQALAAEPLETPPDTHRDDPAIIIYTSGTTGQPKGALHGHRLLAAHMPAVRLSNDLMPQPGDRYWTPADWAWIGGLFDVLFTSLALGVPVVAAPDKFTPQRCYQLIERHGVRNAFLPPTAIKLLRATGQAPAGVSLRSICSGGEAVGDALQEWTQANLGTHINEFYGQTEMNLVVGTCRSRWTPQPQSMGRAYPGFTIELKGPDGANVPAGEVGEICVRADNPGVFLEYWNQPEKTAEKRRDGWVFTGDLARGDEEGNLWFQGRNDDVINTAGYRVGPGEIEECLMGHADVQMAAVVGQADPDRGEIVVAYVVAAEGVDTAALTPQLQAHVKGRLAFYQYPRRIEYVADLPMTTTGKIMRRELRSQA